MTEEEWLGCEDPEPMLRFLSGNVSESQLRLTICACYRAWWVHKSLLPPDHLTQLLREAIDLVERSRGALLPNSVRVPLRDEIRDNNSSLALERFHLRCVGISALMTANRATWRAR